MPKSSKSSWELYARYGLAGAVCASGAHLVLVPIDVVKTRLQVRIYRMYRLLSRCAPTAWTAFFSRRCAHVVPDGVITRLQVQQGRYKGMADGFRTMVRQEGIGSILLGLSPTVVGYVLQGACKFGFYEYFKSRAVDWIGQERASRNPLKVYLASSAAAETVASIFLCPFEALRIRMVSRPQEYAVAGLFGGLSKMASQEGVSGYARNDLVASGTSG
jgi:solute carrier family 25 (mitochondrial phosphate transporter), member 3